MPFQHILVTTDLSENSLRALDFLQTGSLGGARYTLLYVLTDWEVPATFFAAFPAEQTLQAWRDEMQSRAKTDLAERSRKHLRDMEVNLAVVQSQRQASEGICEYARKNACDLIVMASSGAGALSTMVMGSVAQKVIRHSPCPVLVIPSESQGG
jgi:nucleotide-binding universal stress UspA family protein